MNIFEYLPQLIIAYDGKPDDKFANLIHINKADKEKDYYCPCCGGTVRPRALNSKKEQSHYYHITGLCTKESQLHFFCKNWLFEKGSKFYIEDRLFEVDSIEIEKTWNTKFGDYRPDVTVHTSTDEIIYFEMFFTNRKTGDDYFCKWNELGNDVVEVNIKEYMYKTDENEIPRFTYLYHDGRCYSKEYIKRDFYVNNIQKLKNQIARKDLLNYKQRIEQLDWLWQYIMNEDQRDKIPETIKAMCYEDQVSCYDIIKNKNCVKYLKDAVLKVINDGVEEQIRNEVGLPENDNVYFALEHIKGRTYEAGIKINFFSDHITYDLIYCHDNSFKITFKKSIMSVDDVCLSKDIKEKMQNDYDKTLKFNNRLYTLEKQLLDFENNTRKVRNKNGRYTVLTKIHDDNKFEELFSNLELRDIFSLAELEEKQEYSIKKILDKEYLEKIKTNKEYTDKINVLKHFRNIKCNVTLKYEENLQNYKKSGIRLKGFIDSHCIYDVIMDNNFDECIEELQRNFEHFLNEYEIPLNLVDRINSCKNNLWDASFLYSYGIPVISMKIKLDKVYVKEEISLNDYDSLTENTITLLLQNAMCRMIKETEEYYGCRIFWEEDFNE